MAITKQHIEATFAGRLLARYYPDPATGKTAGIRNHIIVATDVQVSGDMILIAVDDFLVLFGSASSLSHADLSAAAPAKSGWQTHLDAWKAKGIIQ